MADSEAPPAEVPVDDVAPSEEAATHTDAVAAPAEEAEVPKLGECFCRGQPLSSKTFRRCLFNTLPAAMYFAVTAKRTTRPCHGTHVRTVHPTRQHTPALLVVETQHYLTFPLPALPSYAHSLAQTR
jgi:hypothetical protein